MISSKELQNSYKKLYKSLREYVWPINVVSDIADFEIAVFRTFPDIAQIKFLCQKVKQNCTRYFKDDEVMAERFEDFEEKLNVFDDWFAKLDTRKQGVK